MSSTCHQELQISLETRYKKRRFCNVANSMDTQSVFGMALPNISLEMAERWQSGGVSVRENKAKSKKHGFSNLAFFCSIKRVL